MWWLAWEPTDWVSVRKGITFFIFWKPLIFITTVQYASWQFCFSAPYTLSVKLSDYTVWRHIWRKNWVKCAVLTRNIVSLRTVLSSCPSNRELHSSVREYPSFLILPADITMASSQGTQPQHPFLAIHSADEHLMIYSFSNTTSYCTFYAFFFSFRITLWPMWLANTKRQPCFYPPLSHAQADTELIPPPPPPPPKKKKKNWWETCVVPENIQLRWMKNQQMH
jgi:hypothetical protein